MNREPSPFFIFGALASPRRHGRGRYLRAVRFFILGAPAIPRR